MKTTGALLLIVLLLSCGASPVMSAAYDLPINYLTTPSGVRFAVVGSKPAKPAPTLLLFGLSVEDTLRGASISRLGRLLEKQGFISVSIDLPNHGADAKGELIALWAWADRLRKNDNWVPGFMSKLRDVVDFLVKEGYTDPTMIAACGTSRGGFIAFHFAAAEPRVKYVLGVSPVTDLRALREFEDLGENELVKSLSPVHLAEKLAGRAVWLAIGNNDERVSTGRTNEFAHALVKESVRQGKPPDPTKKPVNVELRLMPWPNHFAPDEVHDLAYAWLLNQISGKVVTMD